MNIQLNNNPDTFDGDMISVSQLLVSKKFSFKMIVVKINNKVIKQEDYPTTMIHHGDDVMVLHLMSGG